MARSRRGSPAAALLALVALALSLATAPASAEKRRPPDRPEVALRFVSMPDFFNADLGDVSASPGWELGEPNSINDAYRSAIDVVVDAVDAEAPAFVTVAGDLVEGHWGEDADGTGVFGPVETEEERLSAITAAGNLYYGQWRRYFHERFLDVYPAVGDHEIGDDLGGRAMDDRWPAGSFRHLAVPTYKAVWARNFTLRDWGHRFRTRPRGTQWEDTAYAIAPHPETLIVTVDVFRHDEHGVQPTVADGQLRWLDRVLTRAQRTGVDNLIVQGHVPVLGPVRSRSSGSLAMLGGAESAFWQLLKARGVDMYLSGEVHAVTAIEDGVLQISHGGLIARGGINYMVVKIYDDGSVRLNVKRFRRTAIEWQPQLWQTSSKRQPGLVAYDPRPRTVATGRYARDGRFTHRRGLFKPYLPG